MGAKVTDYDYLLGGGGGVDSGFLSSPPICPSPPVFSSPSGLLSSSDNTSPTTLTTAGRQSQATSVDRGKDWKSKHLTYLRSKHRRRLSAPKVQPTTLLSMLSSPCLPNFAESDTESQSAPLYSHQPSEIRYSSDSDSPLLELLEDNDYFSASSSSFPSPQSQLPGSDAATLLPHQGEAIFLSFSASKKTGPIKRRRHKFVPVYLHYVDSQNSQTAQPPKRREMITKEMLCESRTPIRQETNVALSMYNNPEGVDSFSLANGTTAYINTTGSELHNEEPFQSSRLDRWQQYGRSGNDLADPVACEQLSSAIDESSPLDAFGDLLSSSDSAGNPTSVSTVRTSSASPCDEVTYSDCGPGGEFNSSFPPPPPPSYFQERVPSSLSDDFSSSFQSSFHPGIPGLCNGSAMMGQLFSPPSLPPSQLSRAQPSSHEGVASDWMCQAGAFSTQAPQDKFKPALSASSAMPLPYGRQEIPSSSSMPRHPPPACTMSSYSVGGNPYPWNHPNSNSSLPYPQGHHLL